LPIFLIKNNIYGHSASGIYIEDSSNNSIVNNELWDNCRGIESKNSSNQICGNDIQNSNCPQTGIHLDSSNPEIIGNNIRDDAGDGIGCENGANPVVQKNNITNNTGFGLNNIDSSVNIDAQENWWGDASGPAGAGPGAGDEVSENVDFSNWRTEPVAFVVAPYWDAHGAKGTEVTATFYIVNLSDSNDTYNISVSDTLGWGLYPTTFTETVTAGDSKEIQITVSIPLEAPIATENEITLAATSTSNPTATASTTLNVTVGEILINEIDTYTGRVELYNPGPQGISLAGWTLITGDREIELIIPEYAHDWDGILEAGAYLVIHLSSVDTTNSPSEDIYGDIDADDIEEVLSEAGNSIAVLNPSGGGIDFVRYGESEDSPPEGTQWHGDESENPSLPEEDQSLGRDRNSTDTNQASDWENTGGSDADFPTPGWQNVLVCISARSGNWKDSNTWEGEHIPRAIDDAVICEEHIVFVNSLQQCKLLFLSDNATLKVNDSLPEAADGYYFHLLSVVEYSSSVSQTISTVPIYGQLIVSGSGTKIANDGLQVDVVLTIKDDAEMQNNGQMTVERDLELEDSSILTLGGDVDVNGDLYIGENATLNGQSYTINLAGDFNNSGNYIYGTSTVVFDQSLGSQFIGPLTDDFLHFYNLTISTGGSPGTTTSLGNLHVHGDLTVSSGSELLMEEKEIIVDGLTEFSENQLESIAR
jgi:parallel beta-helix repeat protein